MSVPTDDIMSLIAVVKDSEDAFDPFMLLGCGIMTLQQEFDLMQRMRLAFIDFSKSLTPEEFAKISRRVRDAYPKKKKKVTN